MSNSNITIAIEDYSQDFINELNREIPLMLDSLGENATGNAVEILDDIVYSQKDIDWVLTGNLKASITHNVDSFNSTVYIGTNLEYAQGIEDGSHRKRGAVHYLRDAIALHANEYKKFIENWLK